MQPTKPETPPYAELHCLSNFSFGRGASSASELFERAKQAGYRALAITDECSLAGIVRALEASRASGVALIVGAEFVLRGDPQRAGGEDEHLKLVVLVANIDGYSRLCQLITQARRRSAKGEYRIHRADFEGDTGGLLALWIPSESALRRADIGARDGAWLAACFPERAWLAVELHRGVDDGARLRQLLDLATWLRLPVVASGDVHMHVRRRRALQDLLTAIRHRTSVAQAGERLFANGERHLRSRQALAAIYPVELLATSVQIAERCQFDFAQLRYEYPHELVPAGHSADSWLRALSAVGAAWRWPDGVPARAAKQIEHELGLIAELGYASYFLTVHDIVRFARSRSILCQGRGSAANSAVCFALGITEVDPARANLLFERFISRERNEPPDIDIDFEHERREEVIQYIYGRYGRERAALAATVICYRSKSAVRDVARALGLPSDQLDQLSRTVSGWSEEAPSPERLRERGFDPDSPAMRRLVILVGELLGMPRHLSQHVGGFVIAEQPLHTLVPVENAAMPDRTIIQWDKDDLDTLGLLKVDCLALGMLTCVRKCLDLLRAHRGRDLTPATIPAEDAATYAMIQRADTVGVFQIESRAQMAMLPRLKPATFYDLVIEVAIVRPGPIQGKMVHPYLRRRQGLEPVVYPSEDLKAVFERTLGVPLFQEQVMQLAMVAAGYTPGEADDLRRSMAAWKRRGGLEHHRLRILNGMAERGYPLEFAEQVFEQIKGFGSYGFPESHAASFALITYVSCWLKCHEPAAFACALLNSLPMGFYSASQITQDVRRHGVKIRPVDVRLSDVACTLEPLGDPTLQPAIRLGLQQLRGLATSVAERIVQARREHAFVDVADLCTRAELDRGTQDRLAESGALRGLAGHRHRARWTVSGVEAQLPLFGRESAVEERISIAPPTASEDTRADYASTGLTLGRHPVSLIRAQLKARRYRRSSELATLSHGTPTRTAGLVTMRQRPATASGVTFVTLEDEDGMTNVVVWRDLGQRQRRVLVESSLLAVHGRIETADGVRHLIAQRLEDLSELLGGMDTRSRDFR